MSEGERFGIVASLVLILATFLTQFLIVFLYSGCDIMVWMMDNQMNKKPGCMVRLGRSRLLVKPYLDAYDVGYCRSALGPVLFNSCINDLKEMEEYARQVCR